MQRTPLLVPAHGRHAQAVLFNRSGTLLISAGMDAAIRLWRPPTFEAAGVILGHLNSVNSLALSPDEERLATCSSDGTVRVWSFPTGQPVHTLNGERFPKWSPDGKLLTTLSASGRLSHWDAITLERLGQLPAIDRRVFSFAYAPDESQLLVGGTGTIHRVRLHDGARLGLLTGHGVAVMGLALSPKRDLLASTGAEGSLRFWETGGWQQVRDVPLQAGGVLALAWAPDGNQVAVSGDHLVQLIPVREGEQSVQLSVAIKGVYGVTYSPDGRWLVNAGADGQLRVWNLTP